MVRRVRAAVAVLVAGLLVFGAVVATPSSADPPPTGPTVSVGDQSGLERDSVLGSVFVPVFLSEPASEPVVVWFHTMDGSAVAGVDYLRRGTPSSPLSVTIPAGQLQTSVTVPLGFADPAAVDKTFSVVLSSVSGAGAVIGRGVGTATIVDSDAVFGANPAINVSNPTIVEGDAGQRRAQFQIQLSRPPVSPITVTYATSDGTAVAGEDYVQRLPGTVVFAPGQISRTIDVLVNSDTQIQGEREFLFEVDVIGGSPVEELSLTGVATILDDDGVIEEPCPPGTFNSDTGTEPCEPAPPGTFVDEAGATSATPCAPGAFQDQAGQTSCQLAPIGTYVEFSGATTATLCPEGTTTLTTGSTSADDCVTVPEGVIAIEGGGSHSCALIADGTVQCWGNNSNGQLGRGAGIGGTSGVPVAVTGITTATSLTASGASTCVVLEDTTARCWGSNGDGRLGNGGGPDSSVPVVVSGLVGATKIAAGGDHTCALMEDTTMRCWGRNVNGDLGIGTVGGSFNVPQVVAGLSGVVDITLGFDHTCARMDDATMRCWGRNTNGQLGRGVTGGAFGVPAPVSGLADVVDITAGNFHTCAVVANGTARCWGLNNVGQVGNGTFTDANMPVTVSSLSGAVELTGGNTGEGTCARLTDGTARCWGWNHRGQLGDGTTINSNVPVGVSGLSGVVSVRRGAQHACALLADGSVRCWGRNDSRQLGDGTNVDSSVPVAVVNLP